MNTPVLQWIRKHAKNIIKNTVRPHITAIWTPLTRKRGCGRVVRHRRPGKDSRSRAWVRIPRAALFRKPRRKSRLGRVSLLHQGANQGANRALVPNKKRSILNTFSEYLWSAKNFIFSILEQHDFTILQYLWRKKKRKMMHFFPGPGWGWGWAGLGWA